MEFQPAPFSRENQHPDQAFANYRLIAAIILGAIVPLVLIVKWEGTGSPTDFKYFWDAGAAVLHGRSWHSTWFPYPPQALFLFVPFALLPMWPAYYLFDVLGALCFFLAAKPYLPPGFPRISAVLTPAALFCLFYGQTGLFVGALWLVAFQGRWAAVAALTIKPHIGFLSALSLSTKTLVPTVILALVLTCAGFLIFGEASAFFQSLAAQFGAIGENIKWQYVGVSPAIGYGVIGWLVFGLAAAILLSFNVNAFTAATAGLLIAPYAFHYDMPAASLGFLLALQKERSLSKALAFTAALLVPSLVRLGAFVAPPILIWALWAYNGEHCLRAFRSGGPLGRSSRE